MNRSTYGSLSVSNQSDTTLHQTSNVEVVGVSGIDTSDTATTKISDGGDHLVDDLAGVRLHTEQDLKVVRPSLRVFSSHTLERDVRSSWDQFSELRIDAFASWECGEVNGLNAWVL